VLFFDQIWQSFRLYVVIPHANPLIIQENTYSNRFLHLKELKEFFFIIEQGPLGTVMPYSDSKPLA
jgi:hypothetical protein